MGYTFYQNRTKQQMIQDITSDEKSETMSWQTIDQSLRGNVLWTVCKITDLQANTEKNVIFCYLLSKNEGEWGYKDMSESCGPFQYNCPLKFLKMAPVADQEWRDKVIAYHAENNRKSSTPIVFNEIYELLPTCNVKSVRITGRIKRSLVGVAVDGRSYKVNPKYLTGKILPSFQVQS